MDFRIRQTFANLLDVARGRKPRPADPLAAAIWDLVNEHGSHDRLAAALRDGYGLTSSRQTLINWENGTIPTGAHKHALVELGVDPGLWPAANGSAEDRFARLEARMDAALKTQQKVLSQIVELAKAVDELTDLVEDALTEVRPAARRKKRTS